MRTLTNKTKAILNAIATVVSIIGVYVSSMFIEYSVVTTGSMTIEAVTTATLWIAFLRVAFIVAAVYAAWYVYEYYCRYRNTEYIA